MSGGANIIQFPAPAPREDDGAIEEAPPSGFQLRIEAEIAEKLVDLATYRADREKA